MEAITDQDRSKELLKEALTEVLEERRDLLYEVFAEVIEDMALIRAIEEGKGTESVDRQSILELLEGQA